MAAEYPAGPPPKIIKSYIKENNSEVESGKISPSTVANRVKAIKALLSANETCVPSSFPRYLFTDQVPSFKYPADCAG